MLEVFLYESSNMLEQMDELAMDHEEEQFDEKSLNEIFRIMHTIKGSSAIMMYQNITEISHTLEDVFYFIRENHPDSIDQSELVGLVIDTSDFIKGELEKIQSGGDPDGDDSELTGRLKAYLAKLQGGISTPSEKTPVPAASTAKTAAQSIAQMRAAAGVSAADSGASSSAPAADNGSTPVERASAGNAGSTPVAQTSADEIKCYYMYIFYKMTCEMVNIKAYTMVYSLKESVDEVVYEPADIMTNPDSAAEILENGFFSAFRSELSRGEIMGIIDHVSGVDHIDLNECTPDEYMMILEQGKSAIAAPSAQSAAEEAASEPLSAAAEASLKAAGNPPKASETPEPVAVPAPAGPTNAAGAPKPAALKADKAATSKTGKSEAVKQAFISVNVTKMDMLMDLIGELVIAEAVVLQNPDLQVPGLDLTNFQKAANQLSKTTTELQNVIMSMRMMPLNNTFQKMKRIVFDVSRKLGKEVELIIEGEDTEVDKNIIEHISDPLMHLVRNSVDHGVEMPEERTAAGKPEKAQIRLEARNEGGKVLISVQDDGKGLNRSAILEKAISNGLVSEQKAENLSDKEIYNFITYAGFSTKKEVTEYSGRGVGMDVVVQNIRSIGGGLEIDSTEGRGSKMTLQIPLTLAIIRCIILAVGKTKYVIATGNVKEFISVSSKQMIVEPEGQESIMVRGECYPIIRLKQYYHMKEGHDRLEDGIMTIIEHDGKKAALFVDELIGEQEIVVKPLPLYIKKVRGLSGCTQLGDGSISLILDAGSLINS